MRRLDWFIALVVLVFVAGISGISGYRLHERQTLNERWKAEQEFDERVRGEAIEMFRDKVRNDRLIEMERTQRTEEGQRAAEAERRRVEAAIAEARAKAGVVTTDGTVIIVIPDSK